MTFQQTLDLAEIEADMAFERYLEAFNADEHPEMLDQLTTAAHTAQEHYDERYVTLCRTMLTKHTTSSTF